MFRLLSEIVLFGVAVIWQCFQQTNRVSETQRLTPKPEDYVNPASKAAKHEVSDAHLPTVIFGVIGLFAIILTVMAVLYWMEGALHVKTSNPPVTEYEASFQHAPFARTPIANDWDKINQETRSRLEGYHWIDHQKGKVTIPIERAIELIAEEGLPARRTQAPGFPLSDQIMRPLLRMKDTKHVVESY